MTMLLQTPTMPMKSMKFLLDVLKQAGVVKTINHVYRQDPTMLYRSHCGMINMCDKQYQDNLADQVLCR